jgi:anti-sigma factor RsiW
MNKTHPTRLLSEYFDGSLDERQSAEIREHLAHCRECHNALAGMQRLRRRLQSQYRIRVSPYFSVKVMAKLKAAEQDTIWAGLVQLLRPFVLRLAAAMIIAFALLAIWPANRSWPDSTSEIISYDPLSSVQEANERIASDEQALRFALNEQAFPYSGDRK